MTAAQPAARGEAKSELTGAVSVSKTPARTSGSAGAISSRHTHANAQGEVVQDLHDDQRGTAHPNGDHATSMPHTNGHESMSGPTSRQLSLASTDRGLDGSQHVGGEEQGGGGDMANEVVSPCATDLVFKNGQRLSSTIGEYGDMQ